MLFLERLWRISGDSLAYEVVGHDLYAGLAEIKDEFDFSEYDNMKVVGKF